MTSEVAICNQALSWLGGNLITSLDDGTTEAILCKANYDLLRNAVLEEGKWSFATKRFKLLPGPVAPVYGYSTKFPVPSEVLLVIEARDDNNQGVSGNLFTTSESANGSSRLDWRLEGDSDGLFIVATTDVIFCKCIVEITDTTKFTTTFNQALAARIAADIASPLTESSAKEEKMWNKYNNSIVLALAVDGLQGKSDRIRTKSKILERR